MQNSTILVVDDEPNIVDILRLNLEREGYKVLTASNGVEALEVANEHRPELILLDCMMPLKDGYDVCKTIRSHSNVSKVPILMLTAKTEEVDKIVGLELGADDYITKPFSVREVLARVKAHLRRQAIVDPDTPGSNQPVMVYGELEIDPKLLTVKKRGVPLNLTFREFELFTFLAKHPGEVFARETLLARVWGYEYYGDVRTVDVTIRRTREKVEDDPKSSNYKYIKTKRGVGYYFESPSEL